MTGVSETKTRILAVERIVARRGTVSAKDILTELDLRYGITADRKTIYDDLAALTRFLPIYTDRHGRSFTYVLGEGIGHE